jgi:hypothetical protein
MTVDFSGVEMLKSHALCRMSTSILYEFLMYVNTEEGK